MSTFLLAENRDRDGKGSSPGGVVEEILGSRQLGGRNLVFHIREDTIISKALVYRQLMVIDIDKYSVDEEDSDRGAERQNIKEKI